MRLTVVDWNVNGFTRGAQAEFLGSLEWDVACLQEVTRTTWQDFQVFGDQGDVAFDYLPPLAGAGPRYGCSVRCGHRHDSMASPSFATCHRRNAPPWRW